MQKKFRGEREISSFIRRSFYSYVSNSNGFYTIRQCCFFVCFCFCCIRCSFSCIWDIYIYSYQRHTLLHIKSIARAESDICVCVLLRMYVCLCFECNAAVWIVHNRDVCVCVWVCRSAHGPVTHINCNCWNSVFFPFIAREQIYSVIPRFLWLQHVNTQEEETVFCRIWIFTACFDTACTIHNIRH